MDGATKIAGATIFVGLCLLFWPFVADDAYIVGRYAQNAAAGNGLVYNIGEQVSALTSPLHALLETGLALLGLDPVTSYRVIAPILVLLAWLTAIRATELRGPALAVFTSVSLLSPFVALWTVGGLETAMLTCLSTLFISQIALIVRMGAAKGRDFVRLGTLAALMFLTRYDSVLVTGPILLAILVEEYRRPSLWIGVAIFFAMVSGWLIFSFLYYGDIFPTSFYVKLAVGGRGSLDSIATLLNFAFLSGLLFMVFLARPRPFEALAPLSKTILRGAVVSLAMFLIYASVASGQHMMFGYRLFVPYLMGSGLVLSLALSRPSLMLVAVVAGYQAAMILVVNFLGINPAPLTNLPLLREAYVEYEFVTPATYGQFMEMLRSDAEDIAEHWRQTGFEGKPHIYLRTGGTGFWLPDFYVYESLVSYRHGCVEPVTRMIGASHYVQQLGISVTGKMAENLGRARPDVGNEPLLFATTIDWMGPKVTGYLFGTAPTPLDFGSRVNSGCVDLSPPTSGG
ncbi:hypothetical protein [Celeribacter litoreus]|uniref:hypothetical protein n=1 Tax=Celeribacter litoreus TaxID=2876714 RepID=UPI001CCC4538|nr:hypothetical protein [Celeribacter litoreus]MCA0044247.1 hypothetical protein [Celeribacter litoreus]